MSIILKFFFYIIFQIVFISLLIFSILLIVNVIPITLFTEKENCQVVERYKIPKRFMFESDKSGCLLKTFKNETKQFYINGYLNSGCNHKLNTTFKCYCKYDMCYNTQYTVDRLTLFIIFSMFNIFTFFCSSVWCILWLTLLIVPNIKLKRQYKKLKEDEMF